MHAFMNLVSFIQLSNNIFIVHSVYGMCKAKFPNCLCGISPKHWIYFSGEQDLKAQHILMIV